MSVGCFVLTAQVFGAPPKWFFHQLFPWQQAWVVSRGAVCFPAIIEPIPRRSGCILGNCLQLVSLPSVSLAIGLILLAASVCLGSDESQVPEKAPHCIRIATFNVSLNREQAGQLERDLRSNHPQAQAIAAVIRKVRPDILLLNEIDYSSEGNNAMLFASMFLETSGSDSLGNKAWSMPYHFSAPVNTGVPSGIDLNANGRINDPEDAWGYGKFPGQYGMAVLSRYEIASSRVRTLQKFLWSSLPKAAQPIDPRTNLPYYAPATWAKLRLSSKSFWDVPVDTPLGELHVLASHPTPPAFDGPEDRNGARNHDEIKLIQHYIEGVNFLVDDNGVPAGLAPDAAFVVLGDLNSDPHDGGSRPAAIRSLLQHPRVAKFAPPRSRGGQLAAEKQARANLKHLGDPAEDTGDFNDRSVGNLRVDYVLPSQNFEVVASGVFWPVVDDVPLHQRVALQASLDATDHHLVWIDVR